MTRITRRQALRSLAGAGAGAFTLGFYTWRVEPHWLEFTFPRLPIAGLPHELEGRILAQISDVHAGPQVADSYLNDCFRRVQELAPDFVVVTGDWITYRDSRQFEKLRRVLEHMPRGRLGTIGILGNHDYGWHWRMEDVAEHVSGSVRAAGITLLRNEVIRVSGLQFIGVDDLWGPRFDPAAVLAQKGEDPSTIVLCHNPDAADSPVWGRYQGWILAGHTHGGQCKPPFLPPPLVPVKNKRYIAGEISLSQNCRMYIRPGRGTPTSSSFQREAGNPDFSSSARRLRGGAAQRTNGSRTEDALHDAINLYALNHGVLLTPFHSMALMCPATTESDVDSHTTIFSGATRRTCVPRFRRSGFHAGRVGNFACASHLLSISREDGATASNAMPVRAVRECTTTARARNASRGFVPILRLTSAPSHGASFTLREHPCSPRSATHD